MTRSSVYRLAPQVVQYPPSHSLHNGMLICFPFSSAGGPSQGVDPVIWRQDGTRGPSGRLRERICDA